MNDACMSRQACWRSGLRDGLKWYNVSNAKSHVCPSVVPTAFTSSGLQFVGLAASAACILMSGVCDTPSLASAATFRTLSWANSACGGAMVIPTYESINGWCGPEVPGFSSRVKYSVWSPHPIPTSTSLIWDLPESFGSVFSPAVCKTWASKASQASGKLSVS